MKNNNYIKIVYSTCVDENGNKAEPYECLTLEDYMKGYKRKDNCYTLYVLAHKAEAMMKRLVAEGKLIVRTETKEVA
jgi:hypothetical protein